eukprot:TRINITY_DN11776_c0_g3_i1.p1 TRINITY_DN11776_c0_g3~~TRINITY_DN11776_c0_g3_i1.p1  ORF type:complete len:170 (-),score=23.84 TRINITY_DN11776_c0_g3_i1:61-540(-)
MDYNRHNDSGSGEELDVVTSIKDVCWVAEAVMWLSWKHMGCLTATSHCELVRLHADTIQTILVKGEMNFNDISNYARAFARLIEEDSDKASDLCQDPSLLSRSAKAAFSSFPGGANSNTIRRDAAEELDRQHALRRKLQDLQEDSGSASSSDSNSEEST